MEELLPHGQRVLLHRGHSAASMAGPAGAAAGRGSTAGPVPPPVPPGIAAPSAPGPPGIGSDLAGSDPEPPCRPRPFPLAPPTAPATKYPLPRPERARQAPPPAAHWLRGLNEEKLIGPSAARRALIG